MKRKRGSFSLSELLTLTLRRAGVDRDTATSITGHLIDSIFSRYNIVDEEDLADAGQKVVTYTRSG